MMIEDNFEGKVLRLYSRWTFVDVFIADGCMMLCAFVLLISGLWQVLPLIVIPCAYMLTLGSPSKPIMHFIDTYMCVGEPATADKLFMKKIKPRFDWFGLLSPWKDFDAVFV